jgi:hypothetical protein
MLLGAYVRRKRFEARLVAVELAKLLGGSGRSSSAGAAGNGRIHADDMLSMMGLSL